MLASHDHVSGSAQTSDSVVRVCNPQRFRVGDLVQVESTHEVLRVKATSGAALEVSRGYIGTPTSNIPSGAKLSILGNKGGDGEVSYTRFTERAIRTNNVQSFRWYVDGWYVDEPQDDESLKKCLEVLLRDLERSVLQDIRGERKMRGIISMLITHQFKTGEPGFDASTVLDEDKLNLALRKIWERSTGRIDTVVLSPKQWLNCEAWGGWGSIHQNDVYTSDFGLCKMVVSQFIPDDTVLLLDSNRINIIPLVDCGFQLTDEGVITGKYTLELRDENCHGIIRGLG